MLSNLKLFYTCTHAHMHMCMCTHTHTKSGTDAKGSICHKVGLHESIVFYCLLLYFTSLKHMRTGARVHVCTCAPVLYSCDLCTAHSFMECATFLAEAVLTANCWSLMEFWSRFCCKAPDFVPLFSSVGWNCVQSIKNITVAGGDDVVLEDWAQPLFTLANENALVPFSCSHSPQSGFSILRLQWMRGDSINIWLQRKPQCHMSSAWLGIRSLALFPSSICGTAFNGGGAEYSGLCLLPSSL